MDRLLRRPARDASRPAGSIPDRGHLYGCHYDRAKQRALAANGRLAFLDGLLIAHRLCLLYILRPMNTKLPRLAFGITCLIFAWAAPSALSAEATSEAPAISGTLLVMGQPVAGADITLYFFKDRDCYALSVKQRTTELTADENKRLKAGNRILPILRSGADGRYLADNLEPGVYFISVEWVTADRQSWLDSPFQGDWFVAQAPRNDPAASYGLSAISDPFELKPGEKHTADMKLPSE